MEKEGYYLKEEYVSSKMMGFLYNYLFKADITGSKDKSTIYIGISRNTYQECGQGLYISCVDYNPQKTKVPQCLVNYFAVNGFRYQSVNKCDVAMDFEGYKPEDTFISTRHKIMLVGTPDNLTRYCRPSDSHLRIKIYDKKKERAIFGESISQRLRIEITLKKPVFHESELDINDLYLLEIKDALSEVSIITDYDRAYLVEKYGKYDDSMLYLLSVCDQTICEGALNKMSSATKAKYRAYLKEVKNKPISIDIVQFYTQIGTQLREAIEQVLVAVKYLNQY